tara:strand:- start:5397 stop:7781 length:2385 start_codon:yes stop_codon:yes gene_type:complete
MAAQQGINITIHGDSKEAVAAFTKVVKVLDGLEKKTRNTTKATKGAGKAVKKSTSEFRKFFKAGVAAGAGLVSFTAGLRTAKRVLGGMTDFVKESIFEVAKAGDQFAKQGRVLGVTAQEYQGLEYAAERSGTTVKHVSDGFKKLGRVMLDAQNGSRQIVRSFDALGIELKKQDGTLRKPIEVFEEMADKFRLMGPSAERTGVSMLLLGRSGTHLANMMSEGSEGVRKMMGELEDLGAVMSDDNTAAAETLIDRMADLKFAVKGLKIALGNELIPSATEAAVVFRDLAVAMNEAGEMKGLSRRLRTLGKVALTVGGTLSHMGIVVIGSLELALRGVVRFITTAIESVVNAAKAMKLALLSAMTPFGMAKRGFEEFKLPEMGGLREFGQGFGDASGEYAAAFAKSAEITSSLLLSLEPDYLRVKAAIDATAGATQDLTEREKALGEEIKRLLAANALLTKSNQDVANSSKDWGAQAMKRIKEIVRLQKELDGLQKSLDRIGQTPQEALLGEKGEREAQLGRAIEIGPPSPRSEAGQDVATDAMLGDETTEEGAAAIRQYQTMVEFHQWARDRQKAIDLDYYNQLRLLREGEEAAAREASFNTVSAWSDALGALSGMFGAFHDLIIAGYGEDTAEARKAARTMFLIEQGLAMGQAILSTAVAVGKANELGYPMSIPAMIAAGATGATQIAAIMATTIGGLGDAGIPPDALKQAGLNQHSLIAMRNDEMILDPVGTRHISEMLEMQKSGGSGATEQVINTTVEIDGEVLGSTVDKRLIRQQERGLAYTNRVRQGYTVI